MSCDTNALEAIANDDYEALCYIEIAMRYEGGMGTPDCGISTEVGTKVLDYLKQKRRAMNDEKQAIYSAQRTAHTASLLRKLSKPRKKKVRQKEVEALKHREEAVEGDLPESIPSHGFNGA